MRDFTAAGISPGKTEKISPSPVLEVRGQSVRIKETGRALTTGVDLKLYAGESLGIIGGSGSGKTVTLKALMGLLPKALTETYEYKDCRTAQMAMIFQRPQRALDPLCPVGDFLKEVYMAHHGMGREGASLKNAGGGPGQTARAAHGKNLTAVLKEKAARRRELSKEAEAWCRDIFKRMGLPLKILDEKRRPGSLSGGQCQRVCIAAALCQRPQVLLCDEPTTALDATVQRRILLLLKELQEEYGFAFIFVTHDLGAAATVCDTLKVMHEGRIIEEGAPEEILNAPHETYTKSLADAVLRLPGKTYGS